MIKVHFDHHAKIARHIYSFYFRPEKPLRHIAGQFIELYIPHEGADDRGTKRWFTLSSSPTEDLLAITTKLTPDKSSTFKHTLQNLQPKTELKMATPMGDFVLPKDPDIPLLFVAGGIGCTPYRSMIKYLQDSGEARNIRFLYAANSAEEIAFRSIFDQLGNSFHTFISTKLTTQKILEHAGSEDYIYLSGPEPMVETFDKELKQTGINSNQLRTDFFPNYTVI